MEEEEIAARCTYCARSESSMDSWNATIYCQWDGKIHHHPCLCDRWL